MQKSKHTLLCVTFIALAFLLLATTNLSLNYADAQSITLSVSAMDAGGKFFGSQIVQVVVDAPALRDTEASPGSLIVNDVNVPLVHLSDSRWYAFIADGNTFTTLANIAGLPGNSDGEFWIIGPNGKNLLFPSLPVAFGHNPATGRMNPNLDLNGDCPATMNAQDPCVEWPYIRLFNLFENDQVFIRNSGQSVKLDYIKTSRSDVILTLDRDSYPVNAEIIFGMSDYMWNINPVERDRIHFAFNNGNTEVFYQASISLPPASISGAMPNLGFDFSQILSIDQGETIRFDNTINGIPETVLIETYPNSGSFENFDGSADMFAKERGVQFRFDYFNTSISAGMSSSDASVSVSKEEPKTEVKETPVVEELEEKVEPSSITAPYSITELKLVDILGGSLSSVNVEHPVSVQSTINNNLDKDQPFVYIVQVKDENEFTVMLTWIKGDVYAKKSFDPGISWMPETHGEYTIEIFVWKSLDEPGILPLTKSMQVSVS